MRQKKKPGVRKKKERTDLKGPQKKRENSGGDPVESRLKT